MLVTSTLVLVLEVMEEEGDEEEEAGTTGTAKILANEDWETGSARAENSSPRLMASRLATL